MADCTRSGVLGLSPDPAGLHRRITHYQNGVSVATISPHARVPPRRTASRGWTRNGFFRFEKVLYRVDREALPGHAIGCTLTLRDCPPTAAIWSESLLGLWRRRLFRTLGVSNVLGVTEMQGRTRAAPHAHALVWSAVEIDPEDVLAAWLAVAADYGSRRQGQDVSAVRSQPAFLEYMGCHLARGISHYQRRPEAYPAAWHEAGSLGHAWFRWGDWSGLLATPTREILFANAPEYFAWRRFYRRQVLASVADEMAAIERRWSHTAAHRAFGWSPKEAGEWMRGDRCFQMPRKAAWLVDRHRFLRRRLSSMRRSVKVSIESLSWTDKDIERVERERAIWGRSEWCLKAKARAVSESKGVKRRVWDEDVRKG